MIKGYEMKSKHEYTDSGKIVRTEFLNSILEEYYDNEGKMIKYVDGKDVTKYMYDDSNELIRTEFSSNGYEPYTYITNIKRENIGIDSWLLTEEIYFPDEDGNPTIPGNVITKTRTSVMDGVTMLSDDIPSNLTGDTTDEVIYKRNGLITLVHTYIKNNILGVETTNNITAEYIYDDKGTLEFEIVKGRRVCEAHNEDKSSTTIKVTDNTYDSKGRLESELVKEYWVESEDEIKTIMNNKKQLNCFNNK